MTSSFRHGVTITGTILLVTGTLCFAWWSDGEMALLPSNTTKATPESEIPAAHSSSNALLRSLSFFCCGVGGLLLLFGLLWSVKANARTLTQRYQYRLPQELYYISWELGEKLTNSNAGNITIPTYEEAVNCIPLEDTRLGTPNHCATRENVPPLYEALIGNDWQHWRHRRSYSDSALLSSLKPGPGWQLEPREELTSTFGTPPPSYDSITAHLE